jgi:hypothetical protein
MLEDHYRDATGWRVRTFPLTRGTPPGPDPRWLAGSPGGSSLGAAKPRLNVPPRISTAYDNSLRERPAKRRRALLRPRLGETQ